MKIDNVEIGLNSKIMAAAGGSSYISGHAGSNSLSGTLGYTHTGSANHYSAKLFSNTLMIDGLGYRWTNVIGSKMTMPPPDIGEISGDDGNYGDGYVRIGLVE